MRLNATGVERRIGKEINRRKNKMKANVVVKKVNVTMVPDKLSQHQYSLTVQRNTIVLVVSPQNYKIILSSRIKA